MLLSSAAVPEVYVVWEPVSNHLHELHQELDWGQRPHSNSCRGWVSSLSLSLSLSLFLSLSYMIIYLSFSYSMVSLWDGKDGACLKYLKTYASQQTGLKVKTMWQSCDLLCIYDMNLVIQALSRNRYSETLIALYGRHSAIYILDSNSLEVRIYSH